VRFTIPEASLPLWPFRPLEDVRSPTGAFDKGVMERNMDRVRISVEVAAQRRKIQSTTIRYRVM
jgi:hypothetical protein